ncbi:MAG: RNA polymerase subunit sigma-24, partial [Comamonadaceae bacterium]
MRYYRELLNYFTRSVNDRHAAADVVQEAYVRVLSLESRGVVVLQPRALLYHTGRNIVARGAVRQATERRVLETLALVSAESAPSVEREAIARQQLRILVERLETMPPKRRDVFILVRIHGYS